MKNFSFQIFSALIMLTSLSSYADVPSKTCTDSNQHQYYCYANKSCNDATTGQDIVPNSVSFTSCTPWNNPNNQNSQRPAACPQGQVPDGSGGCRDQNYSGDVGSQGGVSCPDGQVPDGYGSCEDAATAGAD